MAGLNGDDNLHQTLTAFADGELDAAATLRVFDHLAEHPESVQWLRDQQRLTVAARRTLAGDPAGAPAGLRERLAESLSRPAAPALPPLSAARPFEPVPEPAHDHARNGSRAPGTPGGSVRAREEHPLAPGVPSVRGSSPIRLADDFRAVRWWATRAAAAVVLLTLGLWAGRDLWRPGTPPVGSSAGTASVIPADLVAQASRVHADCSRLADALHSGGYPRDQGPLADDVERDLHGPQPYPNLASIGFRYVGAGPCAHPLADTVHLLYRSVLPGSRRTVSLFVRRAAGQFDLRPDHVYSSSVAQSPFPMLVWRTDRVVYFLLADDDATERAALSAIRRSLPALSDPADVDLEPTPGAATRP